MEIIQLYKYPESWSPLWIITNLITCLIEVWGQRIFLVGKLSFKRIA